MWWVICIVVAGLFVAFVVLSLFTFRKHLDAVKKEGVILKRMTFLYVTCRSNQKSIEETKAAIFREFGIPDDCHFGMYFGMYVIDPTAGIWRNTADDPFVFEWLAIREMAYTVLVYHDVHPKPAGAVLSLIDQEIRLMSMSRFCHHLRDTIPAAELQGMNPPSILKEIAAKGIDVNPP